jgi:hypothetical protein
VSGYDLLLHVGMPRSSTVLRPQLRARGVAFVGAADVAKLRSAAGWDSGPWSKPEEAATFAGEIAKLVEHAAAAARKRNGPHPQVVLASDRLLGEGPIGLRDAHTFRPYAERALGQVVAALSPTRARVLLHTHRQDRLMELAHLERIGEGSTEPFADQFPSAATSVFDYGALLARLAAVPGVDEVVARPVELADAGVHAFVNDVLGLLGLQDRVDLYAIGSDVWPQPPVYTEQGARLALALHPLASGRREHDLIRGFLQRRYLATEAGAADLLDRGTRERILAAYREANERLFREHMLGLPADGYADDTRTFDLGNVLPQPVPVPPTHVGQVRSTATWRARRVAGRARRWARQRLR